MRLNEKTLRTGIMVLITVICIMSMFLIRSCARTEDLEDERLVCRESVKVLSPGDDETDHLTCGGGGRIYVQRYGNDEHVVVICSCSEPERKPQLKLHVIPLPQDGDDSLPMLLNEPERQATPL